MKKKQVLNLMAFLLLVCMMAMIIITIIPNMWNNIFSIVIMLLLGLTLLGVMRYYAAFDRIKTISFYQIKKSMLKPSTLMINILVLGGIIAFIAMIVLMKMPLEMYSIVILLFAVMILTIFDDITE